MGPDALRRAGAGHHRVGVGQAVGDDGAGAALAALVLAVLRLTRHSVRRTDLDRELRKLLEEEAGKTR